MNRIFEKEYTLRAGDFDKFDRLHPAAVLDLFQDAAGQHADQLGIGYETLHKRSLMWALVRVKFRFLAPAHRYQTVKVKTWPLEPRRLSHRREYCIEDENGERLVEGSSEWVIMDSVERNLRWMPTLYPMDFEFHTELMCDKRLDRIQRVLPESKVAYVVHAGFSDLDINEHVNNVKYANYVMNAINPTREEEIESFQVDYRKEVPPESELRVYCDREADCIYAYGNTADNTAMFVCKLTFKR
ncbi:MAG: hypothetical protein IJW98_07510 [Clostridia bacterium]|nr:hypothetical protein [Clostridia bacterium]